MKILLLTLQYPPHVGGVPRFYYNISKFFSKNEMVVLTAKENGWRHTDVGITLPIYRFKPLNYYRTKNFLLFLVVNFLLFFYLLHVVIKEKIEIIILGSSNFELLLLVNIVNSIFRTKYVVFAHGDGDSPKVKYRKDVLKKYFYKKAKAFIANSIFTKNRLISKYEISNNRIFVLYPGVDTKYFTPKNVENIVERMGIKNRKIILTVGRLDERKGHDMVLRSLPVLIKEIPEIVYLIVGSGNRELALKKLASALNCDDKVKFVGRILDDEVVNFYNVCNVFVMPNRELEDGDSEGFGMVFLEANSCGKPVVGGRCGGAIEAIEEHLTGVLVDPYDENDIADKIKFLLKNENLANQLGKNGRARVIEKFDWNLSMDYKIQDLRKFLMQ